MSFDFPLILTVLTIFTGIVTLVDVILSIGKPKPEKRNILAEYSRSFFPILLIVLIIRSFIAQPYRVPTGSLEPTIMAGDFILVNQYDYGLRLPVWHKVIVPIGKPETGQIVLFRFPVNTKVNFIKRVIGVPGDRINYVNKVLYINGKEQPQKFVKDAVYRAGSGMQWNVKIYQEDLNGIKHDIYIDPNQPAVNFYNLVVPKGDYFMMGDNRDFSEDSRYWGFVPNKDLIGRALFVWMSWDSHTNNWSEKFRWHRIGRSLTS